MTGTVNGSKAAIPFRDVPSDLRRLPRWIIWRWDRRRDKNGQLILTKLPLPRAGMVPASAFDPANQMTFDAAMYNFRLGLMQGSWHDLAGNDLSGGLGIVFTGEPGPEPWQGILGGVDLDGVLDPDTGHLAGWAREAVERFNTFTEISPSGAGLHLYAWGAPEHLTRTSRGMERAPGDPVIDGKEPHLEAYVTRRFFTVTGRRFHLGAPHVSLVDPETWAWLAEKLGGEAGERPNPKRRREEFGEPDLAVVVEALSYFGSDDVDRGTWVAIGAVLKDEFGEEARPVYAAWMAKSPQDDPADTEKLWDTVGAAHSMSLGTVFHHAMTRGWRPPWRITAQEAFADCPLEVEERDTGPVVIDAAEVEDPFKELK